MEKYLFNGEDFKAVFASDTWKIGLLRYSERFSKLGVLEKHLLTDEVFVLLNGSATLYEKQGEELISCEMEPNVVYNIPKDVWHHIVVSKDATVMVVENKDTSLENTKRVEISC